MNKKIKKLYWRTCPRCRNFHKTYAKSSNAICEKCNMKIEGRWRKFKTKTNPKFDARKYK